jgi:hypothetical protein
VHGIVSTFSDRIVGRQPQLADIDAEHHVALECREFAVGEVEAVDIKIAVAELLISRC